MIPIRDDNSLRRRFPIVTILLIAINVLIFLLVELPLMAQGEQAFGEALLRQVLVPANLFDANGITAEDMMDLLRSMFWHGSWMHLIGNMLYLWIFGDNVEDAIGHIPYLIFYLICGVAAAAAHVVLDPNSTIPTLGASGAIAGVLGAYLVLFPGNRVATLVPMGRTMVMREMSALVVLGMWFVLQLISTVMSFGSLEEGGVAFAAHVGGFIAGAVLGFLWKQAFGARLPVRTRPA
jgi:membrane associated rhomboid family serine protease